MFGMGKEKGEGANEFLFDLEKEIEDIEGYNEIVKTIETRTSIIKKLLRKGERKEDYAKLAILLQGYVAVLKVLSRIISKGTKKK